MKVKQIISALTLCLVLAVGICVFTACDDEQVDKKLAVLAAPTNVTINYGIDDTVTFDAVENAESYNVYVYKEGDKTAKVTMGTETTIDLAYPLTVGTYKVSVIAVGDNVNYGNSNGSTPIDYEYKDKSVATQLGKVTNVTMNFADIDVAASKYPTISFKGVEGAEKYSVYLYNADKDGKITDEDFVTNLNIPGGDSDITYMIGATNYADMVPGYYVAKITARGDGTLYTDGEEFTSSVLPWLGWQQATPEITVNGDSGLVVTLENYAEFFQKSEITVNVYTDAGCTSLVTTKKFNYSSSTSAFGQITINNKVGFQVGKEATAENPLVAGTTYYVTAQAVGDGVIYKSSAVSATATIAGENLKEGEGSTGGGGGNPGGPGGGPGGDMSIGFTTIPAFAAAAETMIVPINVANNAISLTGAKAAEPTEGSTYTYTLTGSGPMGEAITGTLELLADGGVTCKVNGFGPFSTVTKTGTFANIDGQITITLA